MMNIKPIKTEDDYKATLEIIETLMEAESGTPDVDLLDTLATLVEAYEAKHYPMDFPDPVEAIKFVMEQKNLKVEDLTSSIGRPNRVYEVLNRKRHLLVRMIWNLHNQLGIPAEALIKPSSVNS